MKPEESVLHELGQLAERMYQLCVDNNIAFVACYSYEVSRDETGGGEYQGACPCVWTKKKMFSILLLQPQLKFCGWTMSLAKLFSR